LVRTWGKIMHKRRATPEALTIRFLRQAPDDEVLYYVRRCAAEHDVCVPLTIVLEPQLGPERDLHEVRLEHAGRTVVSERDPEILLAVRNAFDRLAPSSPGTPIQAL
jgi:hypothetical protein